MNEAMRRISIADRAAAIPEQTANQLKNIARLAPYLSPRTMLNLAASQASPDTIELMNVAARKMAEDNDPIREETKGFLGRFGTFFKDVFNPNSFRSKYDPKNPLTQRAAAQGLTTDEVYEQAGGNIGYETIKSASRKAIAVTESGWSGINNFVFELNEDGTAPTGTQVRKRAGRLAEVVATLGAGYAWNKQDLDRAFKYTEAGVLFRNPERQGSGFLSPVDLQVEQMMNVVGLDADTGEPLDDYRGRLRFGEFETQVPLPGGLMATIEQPATVGGYLANLGWTAKRLPNGSIVEGTGLNLDSGYGSFISGAIDAVGELATDATMAASVAAKGLKLLGLSTVAFNKLSPAARAALPGSNTLQQFFRAGATIDDIPLTSKSWLEIDTLRSSFGDEAKRLNDAVDMGTLSPADRDSLIQMKQSILTQSETKVWDADRLSEMIRTDSRWDFIFRLIDDAKTKNEDPLQRAFIIRNKVFKNRISPEDAAALAQANGIEGYRQVFLDAADGLGRGEASLPAKITQLTTKQGTIAPKVSQRLQQLRGVGRDFERMVMPPPVAGLMATKGVKAVSEVAQEVASSPLVRGTNQLYSKIRNLFQLAPDASIVIDGSTGQRMASIDSVYSWVRNLFPNSTDDAFVVEWMGKVQRALTENFTDVEQYDELGNIVTKRVKAPQTRAGVRAVEENVYEIMAEYLKREGFDARGIDEAMDIVREERSQLRTFNIDEAGFPTDDGLLQRLGDYGLVDLDEIATELSTKYGQRVSPDDLKVVVAATLQELQNHALVLPDWRQVKQIAKNNLYKRAVRSGKSDVVASRGELTNAYRFVNGINTFWKQSTLATIGYLARNLLDGQVALWVGDAGVASMFHRPYRFFKIVMNKAGVEDILNKPMTKDGIRQLSARMVDELTPSEKNLLSISRAESWGTWKERTHSFERLVKTGQVTRVLKSDQNLYSVAVAQSARKIHADPVERILAQVQGIPDPAMRKKVLLDWLFGTEEGTYVQTQVLDAYKTGGIRVGLPKGFVRGLGKVQKFDLETQTDRVAFWEGFIDTVIAGRVERMGEVPELRIMMAHNAVPKLADNGRAQIQTVFFPTGSNFPKSVTKIPGGQAPSMDTITGGIYRGSNGSQFFVESVESTGSGYNVKLIELEMMRVAPTTDNPAVEAVMKIDEADEYALAPVRAWVGRNGTVAPETLQVVRKLWSKEELIDNFPEQLPMFEETSVNGVLQGWRNLVDRIFVGSFTGAELAFEKLPAYRQFKWQEYARHYDALSYAELQRAEQNVVLGAKRLGMSPDDYMGGVSLGKRARGGSPFKRLQEARKQAKGRAQKAGYTLEDVDNYAASVAARKLREYFYDAPKKMNIENAEGVELIFTFIAAQRAVVQRFARLLVANPDKPYRIMRAFNGATELNLPGDYQNGALYNDPITGQWKFRHPVGFLARSVANATGLNLDTITPYIGSPIKGLSVGLTGIPGVAPLGAITLNFLADTIAGMTDADDRIDSFRKTFLPFESLSKDKSTLQRLSPAWAVKTTNLWKSTAMDKKVDLVSREISDASRALWTTNNYDPNNKSDMERFEADSKRLAEIMVGFSMLSQFLGPSAGTPEYTVRLKGVDVNAAALTQVRQMMLEEDRETGNMKFLQMFGEEAMLYIAGKTTSTKNTKGFMMTENYVKWVKKNKFDVEFYESGVGYYFGPAEEDEFSFTARTYLFDNQLTRYRTALEGFQASRAAVASIKYRIFRNAFPTYLDKDDQANLRSFRNDLKEKYNYTGPDFNPNELPKIINDIGSILKDKALRDSPIVEPLRAYMAERATLLIMNGRTTFRSKAMTESRQELDGFAQNLIRQGNLEFARLYDNVLAQETDPAGTDPEAQK